MELCRRYVPVIFIILETRLDRTSLLLILYLRSMVLEADGYSGGIWFLWNSDVVDVMGRNTSDRIMYAVITMKSLNNETWVLSSVYASTSTEDIRQGWDKNHAVSSINEGYAVARD